MVWREYFSRSSEAVNLEAQLHPHVVSMAGTIKSTANTDPFSKVITVDVSQAPLKTALSYAYELKNLENADTYAELLKMANNGCISKAHYLQTIFHLEAQAVYFRCQVFRQIGSSDNECPFLSDYLTIYDTNPKELAIQKLALYIQENGIVRHEYSTKRYYSDSYDFYAKGKTWPLFYDRQPQRSAILLEDARPEWQTNTKLER